MRGDDSFQLLSPGAKRRMLGKPTCMRFALYFTSAFMAVGAWLSVLHANPADPTPTQAQAPPASTDGTTTTTNAPAAAGAKSSPRATAPDASRPTYAEAREALRKATAYLTSISTRGGYLWRYSPDLSERAGENVATPTQIWIQPPGTPSVGMAFLRAFAATQDAAHFEAAHAAAMALAQGQLESGGWDYLVDFSPDSKHRTRLRPERLKNISTFDDDNTQSAIRFLLAYCDAAKASGHLAKAQGEIILNARDYALERMLEAQYPNGAWPQRYDGKPRSATAFPVVEATYPKDYPRTWPNADYKHHYTLNDHTHRDCVETMLDAFHRTGDARFLASARRGGDFLLLAQMPEPQPAWAQQYNARMEPAWARAFEPPSITAAESAGAARLLLDLYLETGDDKFLRPLPAVIAWFKRSAIASNRWARYYELHTNKQLFGDRDGKIHYRIEDISEERQTGYSWSGEYGIPGVIAQYEAIQARGREALLEQRRLKSRPPAQASAKSKAGRAAALGPRVREILAAQDPQGRWITRGSPRRDWKSPERVEMSVFIKNMELLADYLHTQ